MAMISAKYAAFSVFTSGAQNADPLVDMVKIGVTPLSN